MGRLVLALLVLACASGASAQVSGSATPVYHGSLLGQVARGSMDPDSGTARITLRGWRLKLDDDSNGIYPDQEPVIVAFGENSFMLEAGMLRASRSGKVFSYRARRSDPQPIRSLRLKRLRDGSYLVRFSVTGIDLSQLILSDPVCLPTALLVGDDDGFLGVLFTRKACDKVPLGRPCRAHRVDIPRDCKIETWPWA